MTGRGGGASVLPFSPAGVMGSDDDDDDALFIYLTQNTVQW